MKDYVLIILYTFSELVLRQVKSIGSHLAIKIRWPLFFQDESNVFVVHFGVFCGTGATDWRKWEYVLRFRWAQ